eukprot:COSAG06_NODE_64739_length_258_cov_2.251572_1_plen_28_part_01
MLAVPVLQRAAGTKDRVGTGLLCGPARY